MIHTKTGTTEKFGLLSLQKKSMQSNHIIILFKRKYMCDLVKCLQKVLDDETSSGRECGCQLTVYRNGELICDLASGYTDERNIARVTPETLFPVFSVGKGILTTLFHILAERSELDYDDLVIRYWPEYGAGGKDSTTIRNMLSHRTGLYDFPTEFHFFDRFNWEKAVKILENMSPLIPIGRKHQYHAHTYGILIGRLLEKITKRPVNELLKEEILEPLQIDTFFYGVPFDKLKQTARITPYVEPEGVQTLMDGRILFNDRRVLQGLNPSSNGVSNAHAMAKIYAALLPGGVNGIRLLKEETLRNALKLERSPDDPVEPAQWDKFGLGYALCGPCPPWNRMFGHGGACGSEGFADQETGYAVGFTKNGILPSHPNHPIRNRISDVLGLPHRIW